MRLQALKAAIKKTVSGAATTAAVTREAAREAATYAHAGGGYSFRQRKAAGALAEPSAGNLTCTLAFFTRLSVNACGLCQVEVLLCSFLWEHIVPVERFNAML